MGEGTSDLLAQVLQLREILEDTNEQWQLLQDQTAGLRSQLASTAPASGEQLGAVPALRAEHAPTAHGFADHKGPPAAPFILEKHKVCKRRASAFATESLTDVGQTCASLGGSVVTVETGSKLLGELECILVEPTGKRVAPQAFVSTGLVVCLQGMPSSTESVEEWCKAAVCAGWLDLGASVALPNLQMSSALGTEDFEAALSGALEKAGFARCILVGKDWGGVIAVELASRSKLASQIEALVLVGPNTPAPATASEVACPVLLLWARDDEISPFEDAEEWMEALDGRCMPTTMKECQTGGHEFDKIVGTGGASEAVKSFTVSAFVLSELEEEGEEQEGGSRPSEAAERRLTQDSDLGPEERDGSASPTARSRRLSRLQAELPSFLQATLPQFSIPTEELSEDAPAVPPQGSAGRRPSFSKRLSLALPQWIHAGMTSGSE